ncbi:helix-turn-helix transcriptional regulator [Flavobacterium supellecticarium]|uniref:Helix-turn-helix transcriptional regulator n=1 Tax=Flavobacterium supellecticarium TaxID=2565924 RepID=A0A4S4A394_9FLAO|nr:helix-turn-helix transcriptional regulator [Flavobacterium supellecticarium]THF52890.1 helix-turn-helix transcriptional regulator [Flavobacterium supellecticarium]
MTTTTSGKVHQGRNVKRFREVQGIKQEALAYEIGEDWNQQKISLLEQKETIDKVLLEKLATALKVPVEAIENFDEDMTMNIISNTFNSSDTSTINTNGHAANHDGDANGSYHHCSFNPIDKLVESYEENKKLYERLLETEKEKVALLEKLLENK